MNTVAEEIRVPSESAAEPDPAVEGAVPWNRRDTLAASGLALACLALLLLDWWALERDRRRTFPGETVQGGGRS